MCTFLDQLLWKFAMDCKLVGYSMTGATLGECDPHLRLMLSVLILVTSKQACNLCHNTVLTPESVKSVPVEALKINNSGNLMPGAAGTSCKFFVM